MAEQVIEPCDSYEFHRVHCLAAADAWDRAAETARLAGAFTTAHDCNQNAIRMRYLAEGDDYLRELFNAADRLLADDRRNRREVPRD